MDRYTPLTDSQHLHSGRRSLHQPASSSPALPLQNTAGPTTAVPLTTAPATALALPGPPAVAPSTTVVAAMLLQLQLSLLLLSPTVRLLAKAMTRPLWSN